MNAAEAARQEKQGMRVHKAQSAAIVKICEKIGDLVVLNPTENHEAILNLSRAIANIGGRP